MAFKKVSNTTTGQPPRWLIATAASFAVLVLIVWIGWKLANARFYADRTLQDAGVSQMIYRHSKVYGFGPDGNEVVLVIYKMNKNTAKALLSSPEDFFQNLPRRGHPTHRCSRYHDWRETPIRRSAILGKDVEGDPSAPITLDEWKNKYGFGFEFRPRAKYRSLLDEALSKPGSYFAYGRCGVFVLIPDKQIGAFMHVG